MPFALLKYALKSALKGEHAGDPHFRWTPDLKPTYDVVIIGAGGHGLAAAYYLASKHGISNIAVLEKGYLAGGNTARNTTIVRANYLTPEGVAFYKESVDLFRTLSNALDINVMYTERGHFTLAHTDAAMRTARWRAEVNKHMGVSSEVIDADEVRRLCPIMNVTDDVRYPILGALYHPPGAIARHDAVACPTDAAPFSPTRSKVSKRSSAATRRPRTPPATPVPRPTAACAWCLRHPKSFSCRTSMATASSLPRSSGTGASKTRSARILSCAVTVMPGFWSRAPKHQQCSRKYPE